MVVAGLPELAHQRAEPIEELRHAADVVLVRVRRDDDGDEIVAPGEERRVRERFEERRKLAGRGHVDDEGPPRPVPFRRQQDELRVAVPDVEQEVDEIGRFAVPDEVAGGEGGCGNGRWNGHQVSFSSVRSASSADSAGVRIGVTAA